MRLVPELDALIRSHGLDAVFAGTLVEGEGVLLAASVLAERGLLSPVGVWLAAALGAWSGHLIWFCVGRRWGGRLLARFPRLAEAVSQADRTVAAHPKTAIFLLQYLYGVRLAGAVALGLTGFSLERFVLYEAVNCVVWAALFSTAGYLVGAAAADFLQGGVRWVWAAGSVVVLLLLVRRLSAQTLGPPRSR